MGTVVGFPGGPAVDQLANLPGAPFGGRYPGVVPKFRGGEAAGLGGRRPRRRRGTGGEGEEGPGGGVAWRRLAS